MAFEIIHSLARSIQTRVGPVAVGVSRVWDQERADSIHLGDFAAYLPLMDHITRSKFRGFQVLRRLTYDHYNWSAGLCSIPCDASYRK